MAWLKYFDKIAAARAAEALRPTGPLPRFDFASLGSRNPLARWFSRFLLRRVLPMLAWYFRLLWPIPRFGRFVLVTRYADAKEVLGDMQRFPVVYGLEMHDLGGADNVLSVDGAEHDQLRAALHRSLTPEDVSRVEQWVVEDAAALLDAGGGRIDVMRDLITRTATESCCRLFGLTAHDPDLFAEWTMAVSNQLFGDFFGDPNIRGQAQTAATLLRSNIDDAISRCQQSNLKNPNSKRERITLIDRLVTTENMPRAKIRAAMIGLATAFIPTNTLAGGNILEVLIERPRMMRRAQAAARDGDKAQLRQILLEAGAANPALSPGLWRHVPTNAASSRIAARRRGSRSVGVGDILLVCIPSALRDRTRRDGNDAWLMFGHGPHMCLGAELALAHLTGMFMVLLRQEALTVASGSQGRIFRVGPYPTRLDMTYRVVNARRALMVLTFPVRKDVPRKTVKAALATIGNPMQPPFRKALDVTNLVQFLSLSVIERAQGSDDSILLLEISGDGEDAALLGTIAKTCWPWLQPLLAFCTPEDAAPADADALAILLVQGHRRLHRWPWGATGLHFDGLPELSVADIARQAKVARFATKIVNDHLRHDLGLSTRAMDVLQRTRRVLKRDAMLEPERQWRARMLKAPARTTILRPGRKRLEIADWKPPARIWSPLGSMLAASENRLIQTLAIALLLLWSIAAYMLYSQPGDGWGRIALAIGASVLAGLALTLVSSLVLAAGFLLLVRRREKREFADPTAASLDHVERLARRENAVGQAQNHIIAVMPFKPGLVRRLSFAFSMWGIKQAVTHWFRPGFVLTMGTIHKARWFRVPRTEQFVFFSNYDGSWESYLEDFITRAHEGQSAAWSHGIGFPPTRFLILDGASDGDRFKRWVRLQQQETLAWYTRFPAHTAQQIRRNAMIEDGLARATSDTDARRWLSEFGSTQREPNELETQEAQTIIFNGYGRQRQATALFLKLPDKSVGIANWLQAITGLRAMPNSALLGPPPRWRIQDEHGTRIVLPPEARVRFGEQTVSGGGNVLGFTANGLTRAGLSAECGLESFPAVFRMTMAGRAGLLGDEVQKVSKWRMSDDCAREDVTEALLTIYGSEVGYEHSDTVAAHRQLLTHYGGHVCRHVPCDALEGADGTPDQEREHFGFRDGISQPVIKGTRRASRLIAERDLLTAGEFLLGYRNDQGFCAAPITIGMEHDPACDLPTIEAAERNRYPYFGSRDPAGDLRDFGRNGSFLVVRQLDQDRELFESELERIAKDLKVSYPDVAELAGGDVSAEWVGAKIIGRWRDGAPLVGNRENPGRALGSAAAANDFAYGVDDPRGLACPLGAHIRRANPRDSLEPADRDEQQITNRHRLIRRGRSYAYAADGPDAAPNTGLLFMALCADIERQFEFVQRSWLNATSFHGLVDEQDPLLGGGQLNKQRRGNFTIPTAAGPIRVKGIEPYVTLRGGGYFFLPSRSALAFLINHALRSNAVENP